MLMENIATSASKIEFKIHSFTVFLMDGRTITIPLVWYPRLLHATESERENCELIGDGEGIHWPDLDEDLSVEGLMAGRKSAENLISLEKWLVKRSQ